MSFTICLVLLFQLTASEFLSVAPASDKETSTADELRELSTIFAADEPDIVEDIGDFGDDVAGGFDTSSEPAETSEKPKPKKKAKKASKPLKISDASNPKCDQACTNGDEKARAECNVQCAKMQCVICAEQFTCKEGCANNVKQMKKDKNCEKLCLDVQEKICAPLGYEAPKGAISPHHNDKPPPSVEATPAPKIYKGTALFCNLYPASYDFDVMGLSSATAKDGDVITKLGYKQCDKIDLQSYQFIGLRAKGKLSGVSAPIVKIPSVMVFGQWEFGNHQVEFNRYFAKADGPILCNGFPVWKTKEDAEPVVFFRDGKKIATLKYKECYPTSVKNGELLVAKVKGEKAGEYLVTGNPSAIVLGKAGESTGVAFEAWTGTEFGF